MRSALHSGDPAFEGLPGYFEGLPGYFLQRLGPTLGTARRRSGRRRMSAMTSAPRISCTPSLS
jgi:hypothetical protein